MEKQIYKLEYLQIKEILNKKELKNYKNKKLSLQDFEILKIKRLQDYNNFNPENWKSVIANSSNPNPLIRNYSLNLLKSQNFDSCGFYVYDRKPNKFRDYPIKELTFIASN